MDFSTLTPSQAFERNAAARLATLVQKEKSMELAMQMTVASQNSDDSSYFQRLASKIVDNIEVELRNVHLRYEDKVSIPESPFACGITIDSFVISTTDHNWAGKFVARNAKNVIHKLAKVKNLGVYWNPLLPEDSMSSLSASDWKLAMNNIIFTDNRVSSSRLVKYILQPPNTFTLKLIHNATEGIVPKSIAVVDSSNLSLKLDKVQYHQAMKTKTCVDFLSRKQALIQHRPQSPVSKNPRAWWKYALILLTNNGDIFIDKVHIA